MLNGISPKIIDVKYSLDFDAAFYLKAELNDFIDGFKKTQLESMRIWSDSDSEVPFLSDYAINGISLDESGNVKAVEIIENKSGPQIFFEN